MNLGPPHPARAKPVGTGGGQRLLVLLLEFLWVVIDFRSNPPAGLSPDLVAKELELRHGTRSSGTGQPPRSGPTIGTTPPFCNDSGGPCRTFRQTHSLGTARRSSSARPVSAIASSASTRNSMLGRVPIPSPDAAADALRLRSACGEKEP